MASITPFPINTDATGSSIHPTERIGIGNSYLNNGIHDITFRMLEAPRCAQ